MNREIKFRAWNKKTNTMVDCQKGTPLAVHPDLLKADLKGLFIPFHEDLTLMQFTGLLDKNGREIYSGDIIAMTNSEGDEFVSPVTFDQYGACIILGGFKTRFDMEILPFAWEVIGNIYENPELLNQ